MTKFCPVEHCGEEMPDKRLMCDECWCLLSASKQNAVDDTFARYEEGSLPYEAASQSAIRAASAARKKFVE